MALVVREATEADAAALCAYAAKLFSERLPGIYRRETPTLAEELAFIRSYALPDNSVLLMAECDGQVAGLLGLLGRALAQEAHVGSVGVSVDRDHRGAGIGTRLFEALFEWAPAHGVRRIEIEAFANNPDAIRLYERLGFEREGVRNAAVLVDDRYVDVVCMAHTGGV